MEAEDKAAGRLGVEREACHTDPGNQGGQPHGCQFGDWHIQQLQNRESPGAVVAVVGNGMDSSK